MPTNEETIAKWREDFERHFDAKYAGRKVLKTARHVVGYAVEKYAHGRQTDEAAFAEWQKRRADFVRWAKRKRVKTTWENCVEWCATVAKW